MLVKLGVDISKLKRPIRRILNRIDIIFNDHGHEAVITSTYEGDHSPGSLHYDDNAIDFRLPKKKAKIIYGDICKVLDMNYDVLLEGDHIHIEYDPK